MKNQFEFFTENKATEINFPILFASQVTMPWTKQAKEKLSNDIKDYAKAHTGSHLCSGITQLMRSGWVITSPFDFVITTNGDGRSFKWQTNSQAYSLSHFEPEQYGDHAVLPVQVLKSVLKINTGWNFKCPEGWGLMMMPLQYVDENRFTAATGIINPKISNDANVVFFWNVLEGEVLIKAGTPLALMLPIQLETQPFIIREKTEKEKQFDKAYELKRATSFVVNRKRLVNLYEKFFG